MNRRPSLGDSARTNRPPHGAIPSRRRAAFRRGPRALVFESLEARSLLSSGTGLRAEYYDNADFTALRTVRTDATLDFDFNGGIPSGTDLTAGDSFSVRWTGQVEPLYSGTYTFSTYSDGGVRLWVNGRRIIDNWTDHPPTTDTGTIALTAGRKYDLVMEYYQGSGGSVARLEWQSAGQGLQVIPQDLLYPSERGSVLREYWAGIGGTAVANLTASPTSPNNPSGVSSPTSFEAPTNWSDSYGTRMRGYLHPHRTGTYSLYIAGDDNAELRLSTDKDPANARLIASVPGWTTPRQWTKYAQQRATVQLVAGQSYYIEALQKEGGGGDNLAVGWTVPGASGIDVIPGVNLSPVVPTVRLYADDTHATETPTNTAAFTVTRTDNTTEALTVNYRVSGTATNGVDYDLLPGSVTIPAGSRSATITITPVDDDVYEGNASKEYVTLELLDAPGYDLGAPSSVVATATIYDNDYDPGPNASVLPADAINSFVFSAGSYGTWQRSVAVSGQPFPQATQVTTTSRPPQTYGVRVNINNAAPVNFHDTLLLTFYARSTGGASGTIGATFEEAASPHDRSFAGTFNLGTGWTKITRAFESVASYAVNEARLFFSFGYDPQTVQFGGVTLVNYGQVPTDDVLPPPEPSYQGHGGTEADWRDAAAGRIDAHRKAELAVNVVDEAGNPIEGAQVSARLTRHAFGFGSAVAADWINNTHPVNGPNYRDVITRYFNKVVLENDLKWPNWQGNPDRAIGALDWLNANGINDIRGHTLIWPSWLRIPASPGSTYGGIDYRSDPNRHDSQEEYDAHVTVDGRAAADAWLRQRILDHIAEEAGHPQVRGRLSDWDVINEPYTNHDVQDILGDAEMVAWFQAAKAADPDARLFLNDFPSLAGDAHLDAFHDTIAYLRANGAPLEGIGFQGHFGDESPGMDAMYANLDRFAAFGLPMQITEFDQESLNEQHQADFLRDFMTLSFSHPSMDAFVIWGFWQGRHWRPDAALWRSDWSIKPNGQQWIDLITNEWTTDVTGTTPADGQYRTRGYLGQYEIVVNHNGQSTTVTAALAPGGTGITVTVADTAANLPPALAPIADRSIPASQDTLSVPLSATDPDGDPPTYSATVQSLAYVLDQQLGLYSDGDRSGISSASAGGSEATPGRMQAAANSAGVRYPSELWGRWWL